MVMPQPQYFPFCFYLLPAILSPVYSLCCGVCLSVLSVWAWCISPALECRWLAHLDPITSSSCAVFQPWLSFQSSPDCSVTCGTMLSGQLSFLLFPRVCSCANTFCPVLQSSCANQPALHTSHSLASLPARHLTAIPAFPALPAFRGQDQSSHLHQLPACLPCHHSTISFSIFNKSFNFLHKSCVLHFWVCCSKKT